jgi:transcriptional regulator with GAF, ATPase, and Fis domain
VGASGIAASSTTAPVLASRADSLADIDREHIVAVLDDCGWKIKGAGNAAERLGLKPSTLRFRMKKLGIQRKPKPR